MKKSYLKIDPSKIQTLEEVKAMIIILCRAHGWDGKSDIQIDTEIVNQIPVLNNLVKD
jgi:hypothetical protein